MKTFYVNGTILTMEEDALYAEAVCVEDGRIKAVGTEKEILKLKKEEDEIVDLEGKTMLPGFIDGHSHFAGTANSMTQCDLTNCTSFQEIVDAMKAFKEKRGLSDDAWIVGCNYDHNFLQEERHPDRFTLDKISETNPVLLIHASSHMGVTNSQGLKLQGIDEKAEDRPDGRYGRVEGTEIPNGYMEEKVFLEFQSKLPMTSLEELMHLMVEAQNLYASYGITTVQDGMVAKPLFQLLKAASDMGILKLDIVGYVDIMTATDLMEKTNPYVGKYEKHLKLGGYKVFLDGSPQGKTAWILEPYEGETEYRGYPIHSDETLRGYIETALNEGQQLLAHCNGDAAAEQYISQFEQALGARTEKESYCPVMVHAQTCKKGTAGANESFGNDAELLHRSHILLGRYTSKEFWMGTCKPDIPCQRCIGLWIKVYIPSRQSGRATGYDAYRFLCSEPCNEVRTDFRGSGKNFGVRGVESDYRIWRLSVSRRRNERNDCSWKICGFCRAG